MIKIVLAEHLGYCFGVQRAISVVEKALSDGPYPVWTLGPVIHNPGVMSELKNKGVREADAPEKVREGSLVLRAHGTTLDEEAKISPEVKVFDATCPFVKRAQKLARDSQKEDRVVFIVGDREHPEVRSILSRAKGKVFCAKDLSELESVFPAIKEAWEETKKPLRVISQTTSRKDVLENAVNFIKEKGIQVEPANTICTATGERQKATLELARKVDLVLVVGSRTSANTNQLLRIAQENGREAYLVESGKDVKPEWIQGKNVIGIAAGASTPDRVIKEVVGKLEEVDKSKIEPEEVKKEEESGAEEKAQKEAPEEKAAEEKGDSTSCEGERKVEGEISQEQEKPSESERAKEMYDESFKALEEGQMVKGRVVSVDDDGTVLVDVGYKSEGRIPPQDFQRKGALPPEKLSPGDEITVCVMSIDSGEGGLRLSKRKADEEMAWRNLEDAFREGKIVEAPCVQEVKGGLVVDVGLRGFVPASQVERGYVNNLAKYIGKTLRTKVLELDKSKNRVILSQRVVLEEEHQKLREETWANIAEGQIRRGVVKGITDFGVFVDLGGVDGLLHISELSWGRVKHPSEVVKEGEEIEVKVLRVDKEKGKISLGRKEVLPDPWENVEEKYPVDSVVEGEVTRTAPFGAFVQLEPGVEGLVHISEVSDQHISKPEEVVMAGQKVRVKVLRVRPMERKISLSIRQADQLADQTSNEATESLKDETKVASDQTDKTSEAEKNAEKVNEPEAIEPKDDTSRDVEEGQKKSSDEPKE